MSQYATQDAALSLVQNAVYYCRPDERFVVRSVLMYLCKLNKWNKALAWLLEN